MGKVKNKEWFKFTPFENSRPWGIKAHAVSHNRYNNRGIHIEPLSYETSTEFADLLQIEVNAIMERDNPTDEFLEDLDNILKILKEAFTVVMGREPILNNKKVMFATTTDSFQCEKCRQHYKTERVRDLTDNDTYGDKLFLQIVREELDKVLEKYGVRHFPFSDWWGEEAREKYNVVDLRKHNECDRHGVLEQVHIDFHDKIEAEAITASLLRMKEERGIDYLE